MMRLILATLVVGLSCVVALAEGAAPEAAVDGSKPPSNNPTGSQESINFNWKVGN